MQAVGGVCFCVHEAAAAGGVSECFSHPHHEPEPQAPASFSLDSWHSADDSGGLAGINLHHVCLLHHFIDLWAWVCVYVCGRESLFLPDLSVFLCVYHAEGSADLIFPSD